MVVAVVVLQHRLGPQEFSGFGCVGDGGYFTEGKHGTNSKKKSAKGRQCYGDETLPRAHLGSGGATYKNHIGSNGGGAIIIERDESLMISKTPVLWQMVKIKKIFMDEDVVVMTVYFQKHQKLLIVEQ